MGVSITNESILPFLIMNAETESYCIIMKITVYLTDLPYMKRVRGP